MGTANPLVFIDMNMTRCNLASVPVDEDELLTDYPRTQEASPTPTRKGPRIFAGIIACAVAVHLAAMYLWITPRNPMSQAVYEPLSSYTLPMFQQSWSLFAPEPLSAAYYLEVRAVPQDLTESEWIDASQVELEGLHHNLLPTTATNITNKLASKVHRQILDLPDDQERAFSLHYHDDAWNRITEEALGVGSIAPYDFESALLTDQATTAYATQFLKAKGILQPGNLVQYRVYRVATPNFDQRAIENNTTSIIYISGRRPAVVLNGQDEAGFAQALKEFSQ
ncbi:DUF5819 family protein [Timonella sp. A28]|uniref:DUF5819 family protein n=1 Tax=Timonella sp. A28 TaxID=3442640 RepID=UPI003EBA8456